MNNRLTYLAKIHLTFLLFLACCLTAFTAQALELEGVVLSESGPVVNSTVTAYPDFTSLSKKENGFTSRPGEKPGQYKLTLPTGKYYLVAEGADQTGEYYGYHGLNPLMLQDEYHWIPLMVLPRNKAECGPGYQGLGGYVSYKGTPAADSSISVYHLNDEPYRGMGILTNTVPDDGSFWFDLDPGSYILFARKRGAGRTTGPIEKGDLICYFSGNPIEVRPAETCLVDISCYPRDDVDAFLAKGADDPRGRKEEKRRSASLREVDETEVARLIPKGPKQQAVISGYVTRPDNTPLANLFISAYPITGAPLFQMYALRLETEYMTRTDEKGFYRLELGSGAYYLVAREKVGEAPLSGEYYGIYEGTPNHSIDLNPNEMKTGVNIVADSIMP